MSVLLKIPTISLPSKTGALLIPVELNRLAQYFSARPGDTVTRGLDMISKTLTSRGSFPGSTTLQTTSFRVTIPQASSISRRLTNRLDLGKRVARPGASPLLRRAAWWGADEEDRSGNCRTPISSFDPAGLALSSGQDSTGSSLSLLEWPGTLAVDFQFVRQF